MKGNPNPAPTHPPSHHRRFSRLPTSQALEGKYARDSSINLYRVRSEARAKVCPNVRQVRKVARANSCTLFALVHTQCASGASVKRGDQVGS
jgi:hypothetical protein